MLPIVMNDFAHALDDVRVVHIDGKLAAAVEAAGGEIDGADDDALAVDQQHFGVELEMFLFVYLDADVVHGAQAADALGEFIFRKLVRRASHHVDFHSAHVRAHEVLDDHGVLITLVLNEDGFARVVDGVSDAFAAVAGAPDQMRGLAGVEGLAFPVGFETLDDFLNFFFVRSDDGVVARLGKIFRFPVEGFHEGAGVVDDNGFLVSHAETGVAVLHANAGGLEHFAGVLVFGFAAAAAGIQHYADVYAALFRRDYRLQKLWVGEDKHFYAQGFLRAIYGVNDGLGRIIGQNN